MFTDGKCSAVTFPVATHGSFPVLSAASPKCCPKAVRAEKGKAPLSTPSLFIYYSSAAPFPHPPIGEFPKVWLEQQPRPSSFHFFPTLALVRGASMATGCSAWGYSSVSWLLPCCAGRMGEQGAGNRTAWVCISCAVWLPSWQLPAVHTLDASRDQFINGYSHLQPLRLGL